MSDLIQSDLEQFTVKCECGRYKHAACKQTIAAYFPIINWNCQYCGNEITDRFVYWCDVKSYYHGNYKGRKMYGKICFNCIQKKAKNYSK